MKFTHEDFLKARRKLDRKLSKANPPFGHMEVVEWDGGLRWPLHDLEYTPEEAVRVAKWILSYYSNIVEDSSDG